MFCFSADLSPGAGVRQTDLMDGGDDGRAGPDRDKATGHQVVIMDYSHQVIIMDYS